MNFCRGRHEEQSVFFFSFFFCIWTSRSGGDVVFGTFRTCVKLLIKHAWTSIKWDYMP